MDEGVNMSQFSFQIPRPLQEDYVKKRPTRPPPTDVRPITWVSPDVDRGLQLSGPTLSLDYFESSGSNPESQPARKKGKKRGWVGDSVQGHNVINID